MEQARVFGLAVPSAGRGSHSITYMRCGRPVPKYARRVSQQVGVVKVFPITVASELSVEGGEIMNLSRSCVLWVWRLR